MRVLITLNLDCQGRNCDSRSCQGGTAVLRLPPAGPAVWAAAAVTTVALLRWPKLQPLPLLIIGAALFALIAAL